MRNRRWDRLSHRAAGADLTWALPLALALALTGCAGGWRNGPPSGAAPAGNVATTPGTAPAVGPGAVTGAAASPASGPGTAVVGDSAVFVWRGASQSVHLGGDFNAWSTTADPLVRQPDGSWRLAKKLEPGRYAYKFVVDGGTWKEDPTARETVDDGFGGKNSVLVVGGVGGAGAAGAGTAGAAGAGTPGAAPATPAPAPPPTAGGKARAPEQTPDGVLFVFAGSARTVHLAGEFNGWSTTTDALVRQADGTWTIVKKLEPGSYPYKFVVDGTTWKPDEANPESQDDGFGGKNSVVTVR